MEILLIGLPIAALVGYLIGKGKGRGREGAVLGALLGPIGWLIIAVGKSGEGIRKCPFCAKEVKSEARVCRYCSRDLPTSAPKPPPAPPFSRLSKQEGVTLTVMGVIIGGLILLMSLNLGGRAPLRRHIVNGQVVYDNTPDDGTH